MSILRLFWTYKNWLCKRLRKWRFCIKNRNFSIFLHAIYAANCARIYVSRTPALERRALKFKTVKIRGCLEAMAHILVLIYQYIASHQEMPSSTLKYSMSICQSSFRWNSMKIGRGVTYIFVARVPGSLVGQNQVGARIILGVISAPTHPFSEKNRYPPAREASRKVANLTERKNLHTPI